MNKEIEKKICEEYISGKSSGPISKSFGITRGKVIVILKNNGVKRRNVQKKLTIEDAKKIATFRGGRCLSINCNGSTDYLLWECSKGHQWRSRLSNIKMGHWCKFCCNKHPQKYKLEDAKQYAAAHGGFFVGKEFLGSNKRSKWQCKNGHTWRAKFEDMRRRGGWCDRCHRDSKMVDIKVAEEIAANNFGKCLSDKCIGTKVKLKWECEFGHVWESTLGNVKDNKSWCPVCKQSYGEKKFREILEKIVKVDFRKQRPQWLKNKEGNNLEIDGYNEELKLGFEYQGIQHFKYIRHFFKNKWEFNKRVRHDKIKKNMFVEKEINIMFPDYKLKPISFENFILDYLTKNNLNHLIKGNDNG